MECLLFSDWLNGKHDEVFDCLFVVGRHCIDTAFHSNAWSFHRAMPFVTTMHRLDSCEL